MPDLYDPYRNAVRQTLQDKAIVKKRSIFKNSHQHEKAKKFFQKKIHLPDFFNLPEGLVNIILFGIFILIPYTFGAFFTFTILAELNFSTYQNMDNSFAFLWVIGYELVASLLLLLIIKSSINFEVE